ncbi:hypothetical protein GALL_536340 [mine drainage metagenome]|uniref:Uncharacterized protein n=1 Tax=mine drainage metagenome TaxID=410659 RepID=A0A1J5PML1_9ZZZZ
MVGLVGQPDSIQQRQHPHAALRCGHPVQAQRVFHVFIRTEHRQQVEVLKDKAEMVGTKVRQRVVRQLLDRLPGDDHLALVRSVNAADQIQQRGFAATRRAGDHGKAVGANVQVNVAQGRHPDRAQVVGFADLLQNDGIHGVLMDKRS